MEGLASFYEAAGGVPYFSRTDRMGALGSSRGRRFVLHSPVLDFARLHGTAMVFCAPRDAKRKGKIERPFRDLKESFLEELVLDPPSSIAEVNSRGESFLATGCTIGPIARPACLRSNGCRSRAR